MTLRRAGRRDPELRAEALLLRHHPDRTLPVPVEDIASAIGAEVKRVRLDPDLSGILVRERDRRVISVQVNHSETRQRFSVAHELGHLLMHPGRPYIAETDKPVRVSLRTKLPAYADPREEREANQFAAALLMPEELVQHWWDKFADEKGSSPERQLEKMATKFGVSPQAMKYRVLNLGLYSEIEGF